MKKSRRHDLKTNVLSVYIQQTYEAIGQYANYIIGGVVVVVVILVAFMIVQRNRQATMDQAQKTYYEIRTGDVFEKPDLIDQAGRLAAEQGIDTELGAKAAELQANLAYNLAMSMGIGDREKKVARLTEAKQIYEQLLTKVVDRPAAAARLKMSLAAVVESLQVLGKGEVEPVRQLYQAVIAGDDASFKSIAEQKLKTLDERMIPLKVLATQPASAPATGPAAQVATLPAPPPVRVNLEPVTETQPAQ
ncbi:MAG TPA: hypothetical protein VLM89_15405 [Phycisphaerae bacterium]|nr:hypothetical protein [Phycisphaerae bacterium]